MLTFQQKLENYAELAVKVGVNVQKGQDVIIQAPLSAVEFIRMVTKNAYEAGAKHVSFNWSDDDLTRTHFLLAPESTFSEFPEWEASKMNTLAREGAAFISFNSPNPDLLDGIDHERLSKSRQASSKALQPFIELEMAHKIRWTIMSIPTVIWAKKVFPDREPKEGMEKLWEVVFKMTRVDQERPAEAWANHFKILNEKSRILNTKKYRKFHYKAPGTDLTIEFDPAHLWVPNDIEEPEFPFAANIPTEEIFTLPKKTGVNGTVSSTMPLNYGGSLIEDIKVTFKDGRIIDYSASKGYDTLKGIIETDEGSHFLGEVALVPQNSPIAESGLIFFNTLYDENASCHIAMGRAYPTLEGGEDMSQDELEQHGANNSLVHVDFMIGSNELDIDGETEEGVIEPIMRKGNWAI